MTIVFVVAMNKCDGIEFTNHLHVVTIAYDGESAQELLRINDNTIVVIIKWCWVNIVSKHFLPNVRLHV